MRPYIIILCLIILITACAPKIEIEKALPVEEPAVEEMPIEEPEEIIEEETVLEEPEETIEEENIIEIKEDSFYPKEKTIEKNTEIKWLNKDKKEHKIACYLSGKRVTTSSNLKENDFFTYTFLEGGEYTCIDAIYGLRSTITVEAQEPLLPPTGSATISKPGNIKGASLAAIAIIAIIILLFFVYGRKRR